MTYTIFLSAIEKLRASYWFIPSVMAFFAIILSFVVISIDEWLESDWPTDITWLHPNRPDGARALLSTIAGSMITVASVTFSMTITSVSYATSQIGPRLISNFMRDRANQITLGTFISTFLYCLLVLRTIVSEGNDSAYTTFVPHLAILIAILFALASVVVLIYFIHHVPDSINVSNIIARVGQDLLKRIEDLFPEMIDKNPTEANEHKDKFPKNFFDNSKAVVSTQNGYIQVLNEDDLMEIASKNDLILRIEYRPGDFATKHDVLLHAYPKQRVTDDIIQQCHGCFAFGRERTHNQDVLFLIDELAEIIARALSPGINDPFTAISAMDWLQCALQEMASRHIPASQRYDDEKNLRIIVHPVDFSMFCSAMFDKTLPYISADRNAALRGMKLLGETIFKISNQEYKVILLRHAEELKNACSTVLSHKADQQSVEKYFEDIQKAMADKDYLFSLKNGTGWLGGTA